MQEFIKFREIFTQALHKLPSVGEDEAAHILIGNQKYAVLARDKRGEAFLKMQEFQKLANGMSIPKHGIFSQFVINAGQMKALQTMIPEITEAHEQMQQLVFSSVKRGSDGEKKTENPKKNDYHNPYPLLEKTVMGMLPLQSLPAPGDCINFWPSISYDIDQLSRGAIYAEFERAPEFADNDYDYSLQAMREALNIVKSKVGKNRIANALMAKKRLSMTDEPNNASGSLHLA